jgi:hypothetical protein
VEEKSLNYGSKWKNRYKGEVKMADTQKKVEKSEIVWLGADGTETKRSVKGRGRPPKGAEKRPDGNFYVPAGAAEKVVPQYITMDKNGKVLSKVAKGRGRPKVGFVKGTDGNWIKTEAEVTPTA